MKLATYFRATVLPAITLLPSLVLAQTVPLGAQFQITTHTTGVWLPYTVPITLHPTLSTDPDGDFVVVWESFLRDSGYPSGIQARSYDASGVPLGAQFQVVTNAFSRFPALAMAMDGGIVVVWSNHYLLFDRLTVGVSIQSQRYDASGAPLGAQFQVNAFASGEQNLPSVAVAPDGDFFVAWESVGSAGDDTSNTSIQGQRYAASGAVLGVQFQVNTYITGFQRRPSVAVAPAGDYVVVWSSSGSGGDDTSATSIQGQRYAASGAALGAQFQVNTHISGSQNSPAVATDAQGGFVVVWESVGTGGDDTSTTSIQGQRYDALGAALGAQFQVNTYVTGDQRLPAVAAAPDDDFVVVWQSGGSVGDDTSATSIQGQRYAVSGAALGAQFQVNSYITGPQRYPAVSTDPQGGFVVVWQSWDSLTDYSLSVQGQRYRVLDIFADGFESGDVSAW